MKQKYIIELQPDHKTLLIKEYAELDKEIMSLLCEESYNSEQIQNMAQQGVDKLMGVLRTKNLYPPGNYAADIAREVIKLYDEQLTGPLELLFNDRDLLASDELDDLLEIEDEDTDLDDLLDDDFEEDADDAETLNIDAPLKIADDDIGEIDEEL